MIDKSARVGVLMGGMSQERPVSFKSGKAVLAALKARGWDAVGIDVQPDLPFKLRDEGVDVAWIALHGQFGEDGCVQGLLEIMRIPYTGADVGGSAVAMDKIVTKRLLADTDIPMPEDSVWRPGDEFPQDVKMPVVAKFPAGGSTLGLAICQDEGELEKALVELGELGPEVLLEQFVAGEEITCAVLDGVALPVVGIVPVEGFFDFEAKYTEGRTVYEAPATRIPAATHAIAQAHSVTAYKRLGLSGVARADFLVDAEGVPWFLEINTIPGMTATSLSPMAASAVGIDFEQLVERVLLAATCHIDRHDQA
ncbi:MAG: D-alanine--D-alanine ligase [Proteobacteria bacterium]|nr:D-alanine--D-alanine ligase [Pseudomonadota bacterium]MCP4916085.1 D-alanine--D-alanine ligase [Pseudomonadota bacterium]